MTTSTKVIRMRRSPGGRHRLLGVRLTEVEERQIRHLAEKAGLSAQRICRGSGAVGFGGRRRHTAPAQRDAERARLVLASISNNVNQLAKWANTNDVLPDTFSRMHRRHSSSHRRGDRDRASVSGPYFEPER